MHNYINSQLISEVWKRLSSGKNIDLSKKFPKKIVWLSGAPGAGKGTHEQTIIDKLDLYEKPLIASDLLNSKEMREKIDKGFLLDDKTVISAVFNGLQDKCFRKGVLVDGYPRTLGQAESILWLHDQIKKSGQDVHFAVISFMVDERESVKRQLKRGKDAIETNKRLQSNLVEVRPTDLDPNLSQERYHNFIAKTARPLRILKQHLPFFEINTQYTIEEVRSTVKAVLETVELSMQ